MTIVPVTRLGKQLWRLLPEVYRERDNGDLAAYIDSFGAVLDGFHAVLNRRVDDVFPDTCQPWLLPYIARLLDVKLVSPDTAGRRREVADAIAWRKRKGTVDNVETIAGAIGSLEEQGAPGTVEAMTFEVREAWQRLARTPRIGTPILPANALGLDAEIDPGNPLAATTYIGLPLATVDLRRPARARRSIVEHARSGHTRFGSEIVRWDIRYPQGTPCFPVTYEDPSLRTPDMRNPDWRFGHFHPKRALLFTAPPAGFFDKEAPSMRWERRNDPEFSGLWKVSEIVENTDSGKRRVIRYHSLTQGKTLKITGVVKFDETLPPSTDLVYRFEGMRFEDAVTVKKGRVEVDRCAFSTLHVFDAGRAVPALSARNSLFRDLKVARGLARLEYCTVLDSSITEVVHASDTVFCCPLFKDVRDIIDTPAGFIRYSSLPAQALPNVRVFRVTHESPIFFSAIFGEHGCGVLHPATSEAVRFGSEEGGEIGAYHHRHYCLRYKAVYDKLDDFMPVGMKPVIIPDQRLLRPPPHEER